MPIVRQRAEEQGTNEAEIQEVLLTGFPMPAKYGRQGKAKIYPFRQTRHGKYYEQKRVGVILHGGERMAYCHYGVRVLWKLGAAHADSV
jgi:hypothetical protein